MTCDCCGVEMRVLARGWTPIVGLLSLGGPTTVIGGVVPVDVNAVDCVVKRWSLAHICEEAFKRVPSIAYLNAALGVVLALGVLAAILHGNPTTVRGTAILPMGSKLLVASTENFREQAPATLDNAVAKSVSRDCLGPAALTTAQIRSFPVDHSIEADNCESPKDGAFGHMGEVTLLRHV